MTDKQKETDKYPNRWKPGESGNLKGRPKKRVFSEYAREHLTDEIAKELFDKMMSLVREGNTVALRELLDRTEGRPKQTFEHEGSIISDVNVRIIRDAAELAIDGSIREELPE